MVECSFEKDVIESLRALSQDKKREVADFIEFLRKRSLRGTPVRVKNLWSEFKIDITPEDISEIREEMWSSFPREFE